MILDAPLGDIVQEQRDAQHGAMPGLDRLDQLVGQAEFRPVAALDLVEHADAAEQMLVHRIVMIHVELHHRHDAAERVHEGAEHAGFVHAPQHDFGGVVRGQNFQEQAVCLLVLAQTLVDQLERTRGGVHGLGMQHQIVLLRQIEQPDQVDRVALEHVGARNVDAVIVDDEIVGVAELGGSARRSPRREHPAQHRRRLGLHVFESRAQDGGQVADVLGGEEVMLHEALDVAQPRMRGVAEPHRDIALDVERQAFLGAAGEEMHVAADRPQEVLAAAEHLGIRRGRTRRARSIPPARARDRRIWRSRTAYAGRASRPCRP